MIRKTISFTLILLMLFLVYQFLLNGVKSSHSITYKIGEKDDLFEIEEDYVKEKEKEYYFLNIKNNDKYFLYKIDNYFNKQKEIIKDIETFEYNGYYCIFLEYINNKHYTFPMCSKDGVAYSYNSLKNVIDFSKYLEKIDNPDYEKYSKESEKISEVSTLLNKAYFDDNETLIIYNYKQVNFHYKNFYRFLSFSSIDNYKNSYGFLVGKYYLIPKINKGTTMTLYYIYDVVDGTRYDLLLDKAISKQTYINGVYDNKLYLFDKSELRQIAINPESVSVSEVGSTSIEGIAYINGEKKNVSVYDLNKENVYFSENLDLYKDIDYNKIYVDSVSDSAIYEKKGYYYKVFNNHLDEPIVIFNNSNAKNIIYKNGNLYYVEKENIYKVNDYGTFIMASNNEFNYNYENIFDVYFDSK